MKAQLCPNGNKLGNAVRKDSATAKLDITKKYLMEAAQTTTWNH